MATVRVSQAGLRLAIVAAGTTSLTAAASLTSTALDTEIAAAPLTATSSLSSGGTNTDVATSGLTSAASLTATAVAGRAGATALTATAALSSTASVTKAAAEALNATASLTTAGALQLTGGASLAATASLTSTGALLAAATTQLLATAQLGSTGILLFDAGADLIAVATLGSAGDTIQLAVGALVATAGLGFGAVVAPPDTTVGTWLIRLTVIGTDRDGTDVYGDTLTLLYGPVTWPRVSTENLQGGDVTVTGVTMLVQPGVDVDAVDQVLIDGQRYDVDGDPAHYKSPFTGTDPGTVLQLVKATG